MRVLLQQILIILLFAFAIKAEPSDQKFLQTQWTTENGLPQNSVAAIAQTADGYLWLGTFGGLARFDGVRFKIYTTANTPELKSNRISVMTTDNQGTLWIGTERGEIVAYKDGKFSLIDDGKKIENVAVSALLADDNGVLWTGSSKGLQICTVSGCKIEKAGISILQIRQDTDGTVWCNSEYKLFKFENGNFIAETVVSDPISSFENNPKGGFWLVKDNEIGIYQNGEYKIFAKLNFNGTYVGTSIAPDGSFWLHTDDFLYCVKNEKKIEYKIENVGGSSARKVFLDREGNVWLGRIGNGLIRLLNRRVQTLSMKDNSGSTGANSIIEDRDGSIWITTTSGLFQWKDQKLEVSYQRGSKGNYATRGALLVDREGTLWNGTSQGLLSLRDGKFTLHEQSDWVKNATGSSLFEDSRKNLWYGCEGCGVFVSDKEKVIRRYTMENGLIDNTVNFITETRDGAMWFATRNGVSRLKDGAFTNYKSEDGLSNEYVRDITEDADGTLWFGTYGGGLNRFHDGKFTPITSKDGLFEDIVSRILVDDDDNFWMLGNRGIFSVSRKMLNDFADGKIKQIYCSAYTTADGMITSEGNGGFQNAGTRTSDGRLWFPMINSVVIIDPNQEKLPPPNPLIEEILVGKEMLEFSGEIELPADHDTLEIHYTGIGFRKPEQMRFRYRLENLNDVWEEAGTRRTAYFPRLPYGEYRFQVIAANADGIWSDYTQIKVVIAPPWHRTWWFYGLMAFVFFGILYGVYQYRNWYFARQKATREEFARRLLNAQETERRRIAAEIHDNLGQQLLIIKNWAAFCLSKMSNRSKMREQLLQIDETAAQAINEIRSMAKTLSPYHLDKAGLTNTIRFMVKQVAESCEIDFVTEIDDVNGVLPKEDEINVYRIVQESVNNIVRHSQATHASVILEQSKNSLKLSVSDNGIGFRQTDDDYQKFGLGLNGMLERAKMSGGEFVVQSALGKGTKILVEFKLK